VAEYLQEPPNCIQIEPTEGCNLRCSYCGIQGIRDKGPMGELSGPYKFMSIETAQQFSTGLHLVREKYGWNPRIEIAMHGEPTLNVDLGRIVYAIRRKNPKTYILIETNGIPLLDDFDRKVRQLFAQGVSTIAIDDYRPHRVRESFHKFASANITKFQYPLAKDGNPHSRRAPGVKTLVLVEDIASADDGNHSHLSNHAGCAAPKSDAMAGQRCALPFRELSIRWDGSLAVCCNDWRGIFKLGNIHQRSLYSIWHDPAMYAIRKKLYAGERDMGPCDGCTHRSYRVGLLPDKFGKKSLPAATPYDIAMIENACEGSTLTPVTLRPYEKP
jgi:MoaA/NifB/PqqE/SkfB family radical SAM enzyme